MNVLLYDHLIATHDPMSTGGYRISESSCWEEARSLYIELELSRALKNLRIRGDKRLKVDIRID